MARKTARQKKISSSLKLYWGLVKRASHLSGVPISSLRSQLKKKKNVSKRGFHQSILKMKIKGGKKSKYVITAFFKEKGGRSRIMNIAVGIGAKNSKALKHEVEYEIKKFLASRGYILEKYFSRFARAAKKYPNKFTVIKDFRFITSKE